jgi:hypothetical protein
MSAVPADEGFSKVTIADCFESPSGLRSIDLMLDQCQSQTQDSEGIQNSLAAETESNVKLGTGNSGVKYDIT